ncbi:unnamed protein product [Callosobruchus maculatus]|uniref:Uncharacterized protein n=1 Tax=Callosobruchus maculatus TaxID=64391 RepID=A0A653BUB8_CALMS|nr:unnamed protein product [Callosobruchus maculatus]
MLRYPKKHIVIGDFNVNLLHDNYEVFLAYSKLIPVQ